MPRLPTRPMDTSPEMLALQESLIRGLSPAERWAKARGLMRAMAQLAMAGLRQRFPDASEQRIHDEFVVLRLGPDLARRVLNRG